MAADNTPQINARSRKPRTTRSRLRLEMAKRLRNLSSKIPSKNMGLQKVEFESVKTGNQVDSQAAKVKEAFAENSNANTVSTPPKLQIKNMGLKKPESEGVKTGNPVVARKARPKKTTIKNTNANTLSAPPKPQARFRRRQIDKTWLPTHLFHSKRARMTAPKEPLWRFAIPLAPTEKSYRPTHRASSSQGAIAWDMSYIATIGLDGHVENISEVLKAAGVGREATDFSLWEQAGTKWRDGRRTWEGWIHEKNTFPARPIALVTVIWCPQSPTRNVPVEEHIEPNTNKPGSAKKALQRRLMIRVHPSAFLELWNELLASTKAQYPPVMVEDLRFEIGSIEVTGYGSTEALQGILKAVEVETSEAEGHASHEYTWSALRGLTNAGCLPSNALLGFSTSDPRLSYPPRGPPVSNVAETEQRLLQVLSQWPPDRSHAPLAIFNRETRVLAGRRLISQKAVNRRKSLAPPGKHPGPLSTDPRIPVLLAASRSSSAGHGTWTVLLPWKWVLPVWYSLMHYPLSTGGNVRFGGLQEKRQVTFEVGTPWFPADYPGTKAGWDWEMRERTHRKAEWEKRPKGKRTEWASVNLGPGRKGEIGLGWACDWERLLLGRSSDQDTSIGQEGAEQAAATDPSATTTSIPMNRITGAPASPPLLTIAHVSKADAELIVRKLAPNLRSHLQPLLNSNSLCTIKITPLTRGTPTPCARLYRLPTKDSKLRQKWLDLRGKPGTENGSKKNHKAPRLVPPGTKESIPPHERRRVLAASLLAPLPSAATSTSYNAEPMQAGDSEYPVVPNEEDLIGFVTTGQFSLGEGRGVGIGSVLVKKIARDPAWPNMMEQSFCIIREAGLCLGRLARWELV